MSGVFKRICLGWCAFILSYGIAQAQEADLITMDFKEVELRQVVRFMSEMSGRNFIVSDKVKGKITVITPTPVTKEEANQLFEAILDVHGYNVVSDGAAERIVPHKALKSAAVPVSDVATPAGVNIVGRVFKLKYVDANSVAATLKPLVSPWGHIASNVGTNSLILLDSSSNIAKFSNLLGVLDAQQSQLVQRAFVIRHANIAHVEKLLNSAYSDFNSRRPKGLPGLFAFSDVRTNTLLVMGPDFILNDVAAIVHRVDKPVQARSDNLHLYYPKNNKAVVISKVLNELVSKQKADSADHPVSFTRQVSVVADEEANVLVVSATADDYQVLLPIIQGLDMRRRQVFIEAAILEISDERVNEFGVDWRITSEDSGSTLIGGSGFGNISATANNPLNPGNGLTIGLVEGTITDPTSGKVLPNIGALVKALRSDNDVNVLSTPNLLVLENEEAEISVGQNVPFLTGKQTSDGGNVVQTIERQDVGLKLTVTPRILSDGEVVLDIFNEISSIAQSVAVNQDDTGIITNKRSIDTSVMLENKQTVVLGGLISEDESETVKRVPVLGSLPVLGQLFRSTERSKTKQNLMVFLRPVVIESYAELSNLSKEKYDLSSGQWNQNFGVGGGAFRNNLPRRMPIDINQIRGGLIEQKPVTEH